MLAIAETLQDEVDRLRKEVARLKSQLAESPKPRWAPRCLELTPGEDKIIRILAEHPDQHFTAAKLMALGWKRPYPGYHLISVHLTRARQKMKPFGVTVHSVLSTIHGRGHLIDSSNAAKIEALRRNPAELDRAITD